MADPFSITSLIITTLKTISVAKNYVETICRAPRSVSSLSNDLAEIETLLRQLGHITKSGNANELEMHQILAGPIATCESVSNELHKLIGPFVKTSGGMKVWGRITFGFKESEVRLLSTRMGGCKQNLALAIGSANLLTSGKTARGIRRIQTHLGIETSSIASDDVHGRTYEHIEKWNNETETIIEEDGTSSHSPPGPTSTSPPNSSKLSEPKIVKNDTKTPYVFSTPAPPEDDSTSEDTSGEDSDDVQIEESDEDSSDEDRGVVDGVRCSKCQAVCKSRENLKRHYYKVHYNKWWGKRWEEVEDSIEA